MAFSDRETIRQLLLQHALKRGALTFGMTELRSGRMSPYFFNSGKLTDGKGLALLGDAYASALSATTTVFEVLYGPPYKGIPLISATASALWWRNHMNRGVTYSRKERKTHGEGGWLVGDGFAGKKVLIVDDVITTGSAIQDSVEIIHGNGNSETEIVGAIVALDRQERGLRTDLSAVQEIEQKYGFPVLSVFNFDYLIRTVERGEGEVAEAAKPWLSAMQEHREQYGV